MWTAEHTIVTDASKEAVWQLWADAENWKVWDKGVEWCRMEGEFKVGTQYMLKPVGGPKVKAIITECQPFKRFVDVTNLPLAKMAFAHELVEEKDGLHVTHRVTITGPLSFLFAQLIGKDTARDLPETMGRLARMAKESV
ncbi:MAG: SRPBCC family protein [Ardenticatenaceae bacterium]|nr:SRPBCC family protein [Anaerolineales bacterium]MCB8922264.1 SRPBCC family protein [Ardenticatenaceae bacterium]MCB8990551.1 SRPBCC family protein [Ardenticatenaceae bacterium]